MKKIQIILIAILALGIHSCQKIDTSDEGSTFVLNASDLKGTISDGVVTLSRGTTYKLTGPLFVKAGATLKIEEGTTIEAQTANGASSLYIVIERGAKIDAQGSATSPIIFTTSVKERGSWGGLVIAGRAPNNIGTDVQSEVAGVVYGGTDAADNSGILKYCILQYSGAKINDIKEFNGISFCSVGSGTIIQYIQVSYGNDDAFEWYGGSVDCSFLYANNNDDDNLDTDEGYNGTISNAYCINSNTNASSDSRGIESDNNPTNFTASPIANPKFRNITLIGRKSVTTGQQREGIYLRRGTKGILENIYIENYSTAIGVEHNETIAFVNSGDLKISTCQITNATKITVGKDSKAAAVNVSNILTQSTATGAGSGAAKPNWANFIQ
jgi:predicted secreted protein